MASAVVSDVASLVSAVVWPAVVAFALWLAYRAGLMHSLQRARISGFGVDVDLAVAEPAFIAAASAAPVASVRDPMPAFMFSDSTARELLDAVRLGTQGEYISVDLDRGFRWLSSRLYLFTAVLQRVSRIRTLVFVYTAADTPGRLLGVADVAGALRAMGRRDPELERAWGFALHAAMGHDDMLIMHFLSELQKPGASPPKVLLEQAPSTPIQEVHEHGVWLDAPGATQLLGDALRRHDVISSDLSADEQFCQVLRLVADTSDLARDVAVVDRDRLFVRLIDRIGAAQRAAVAWADESCGDPAGRRGRASTDRNQPEGRRRNNLR